MNLIQDPTFDAKDESIRVVLEAAARAVPSNWRHLADWQALSRRIIRVRGWRLVRLYLMPVQFRITSSDDLVFLASDGAIYRYHYEQGQPSTSGGAYAPSWSTYRRMGRRKLRNFTPNQLSALADTLASMNWKQ